MSDRVERAREAARLRDSEGLNGIQIAKRMGVSRSYAYELLSDPEGLQVAARKASYGRPCRVCGELTNGSKGRSAAAAVCQECLEAEAADRRARIVAAWNAGERNIDIARRFGLSSEAVRSLVQIARAKGEHVVPHRRGNRDLWPLIERRWAEGASAVEIAREAGATPEGISEMVATMREAGIELAPRAIPARMRWPMIARMWREGHTGQEIAAECGIAADTVYGYLHRMRRKGVDLPKGKGRARGNQGRRAA